MKRIILGVLLSCGFFHSAFALNITSHSGIQENCDGGTFSPLVIYGTDTVHLWDYLNASGEGLISSNSEVSVYVRGNKANIPNGWVQVSNYMPSAGQFYSIWNNQLAGLNLPSLVPADRDTPVAQVVYRVRRMYTGENNTYNFNGNYTYANFTGGIPVQTSLGAVSKSFDLSTVHVDNECISIVPRWCWDGVVDAGKEICDLWPQNGQPGSTCSPTCTPVTVPPSNPYSACVVGNPTADCSTNTYTDLTACLAANPIGSGRICYLNDIPSCNTARVTQCSAPAACVPGPTVGTQSGAITATTPWLCQTWSVTAGSFSGTTSGNTTTYTWSCNGSAVGGACTASYTAPIVPTPPGWTGGGGITCVPGNFTRDSGNVVPAPITAATSGLCPAGETVGNFTDTLNGSSHRYAWSCNSIGAGLACTAFYNGSGGGWVTPPTGGGWVPTSGQPVTIPGSQSYCGNGAVERPNAAGQYENCDTTAAWCQNCNIISTNPGAVLPGKLTITTPGSAAMNINAFKLIVWNQVPVFSPNDVIKFEKTDSLTGIYLDGISTTLTNQSSLINGATVSKRIDGKWVWGIIRFQTGEIPEVRDGSGNIVKEREIIYEERQYPNSIVLFQGSELQGIQGNTSNITSGSYNDTIVTNPTYHYQGLYASIQYLESPFNVRVSKPIIANVAGGSAFVGGMLGYNLNTVVSNFMNNLRSGNFTTSTVNVASSYGLSSVTRSVSDNNSLSQLIASGSQSESDRLVNSSRNTSGISTSVSITSDVDIGAKSTKLGDADNIRVFKGGDVSIDQNLDISGVKTIIVEDGNLIINKDIRYAADKTSSFAWIVKHGNVIVASSVKNIAGVYVTLNGAIMSDNVSTPNRLTVDGSLYGNTSDLVNHRSYVRGQMDYSALNVGVVVNYSNRAIMYPPPSLSRFLDQYSMQRVVR